MAGVWRYSTEQKNIRHILSVSFSELIDWIYVSAV